MIESEVRAKVQAAKDALFALEEYLGKQPERQRVYALRVELGYIAARILATLPKEIG